MADATKPDILVIWGDDIGITNLSRYSDASSSGPGAAKEMRSPAA